MKKRLVFGWLLILFLMAAIGSAQQPPARTLSLAEALDLARRNNPGLLSAANDRWAAAWQVRSTTLSLVTPNAAVSGSWYASEAGQRSFFGQLIRIPGVRQTSYEFGLSYQFSGISLTQRGQASAMLRAVEEDIAGARTTLETTVRGQYLTVLSQQALRDIAQRSVERATENLALAQARYSVGQGTLIDVRRAEVEKGQAEVTLLQAEQAVENQILVLFQQLGVPAPPGSTVVLTDSFPVTEPRWELSDLVRQALEENPGLRSLRARQSAARWNTRAAYSRYLPSLSLSAGTGRVSTRADTANAVSQRQTTPWSISLSVSLPIYDGFGRQVQAAEARAAEDDLRLAVRGRELAIAAQVTAAFNTLQASYRSIDIQRRNRDASAEALELATQRYRVGSGSYLELLDARVAAERAAADYVRAVYDYHRAIADLENAVGRPLR
ncbi:MAG TPA: TolC family protein [Gemmatimonadales bacterium]|nr:TolC family protein [Gemmatimonadales bacterium]